MWLAGNIETLFRPCGLYLCVFLLSEMQTREAYKHYLWLKALTPCVFFPPWPTFRWWYLTERERKALRIRGPTPLELLISLFHSTTLLSFLPSYSIAQWEVDMNFMCLHMVSINPFLFSSQPPTAVSISTLPHFLSFSPVLFVSPVTLLLSFLLICSLLLFPLPSHHFSWKKFSKPNNKYIRLFIIAFQNDPCELFLIWWNLLCSKMDMPITNWFIGQFADLPLLWLRFG